jgi:hypothetical protein
MDGEPAAAAQAERIAECDDIDGVAIAAGTDYLACGDGDGEGGCRKAYCQMFKVHRASRRLRRWAKASEALLARFDHSVCADSNEIRREEMCGFLRGLCVQPTVFHAKDGLSRGPGLGRCLRCRAEEWRNSERQTGHQTGDDTAQSQILIKIFLR